MISIERQWRATGRLARLLQERELEGHARHVGFELAVWALEEIGQPYELVFVDILKGGQKAPEILAINPMGKLPTLTDGEAIVTEVRRDRAVPRRSLRARHAHADPRRERLPAAA